MSAELEIFNTDERLEITTTRLSFRWRRGRGWRPLVLNLEKLREQACKSAFAVEIDNSFNYLQSPDTMTDRNTFKEYTLEAAKLVVEHIHGTAGD